MQHGAATALRANSRICLPAVRSISVISPPYTLRSLSLQSPHPVHLRPGPMEEAETPSDYGFTRRPKDAWSAQDIADLPEPLRPDRAETLDLILRKRIYLLQSRRGYRANTDSQVLAYFAWRRAQSAAAAAAERAGRDLRVLDLGAGNGLVSVLYARATGVDRCVVRQIELQGQLALRAARNLRLNAVRGTAERRDLADGVPDTAGEADVVLVNPPFYANGARVPPRRREKLLAHVESSACIGRFAKVAADALAGAEARLFVVYDVRESERLYTALKQAGLRVVVAQTVAHGAGEEPTRLLVEAARAGEEEKVTGADFKELEMLPSLYLHPPGSGLYKYSASMEEFLESLPEPIFKIGQLRP